MTERSIERRRKGGEVAERSAGHGSPAAAASREAGPARRAKPQAQAQPRQFEKKVIALVYDFDGTLSPKPMQEYTFLPKIGEDPKAFWAESNRLAKEHEADGLITYMHLMYKKAKAAGVRIDREDLVALGRGVELYPGVEAWFDEIAEYV